MKASLTMYARPEVEGAHARYWALIRAGLMRRGIEAPPLLDQRAEGLAIWRDPALVLSQTCGMPYRQHLRGQVSLVGTPDYGLPGCAPGWYNSVAVVRADAPGGSLVDFAAARFAYNEAGSQSGFAAAWSAARQAGFWFGQRACSGAHRQSARWVAEGRADIAFVDAQSWRLMQRYDSFTQGLREVLQTEPTPGLPYITAQGQNVAAVHEAVAEAIAALGDEDRGALGLRGIVRIPEADYLGVADPPDDAA